MRRGYILVVLAGCGFGPGASSSSDDAGPIPDGNGTGGYGFTLADLRAGQGVNMTVDAPRVALTPNAYTYGGLVARGLQNMKLWTRGDTSWTKLDGKTPSGAGMWRGERLQMSSNLGYLGITNQGNMTVWFEGEVWLEASSAESFTISADDMAFVEIALPGTTSYTLVTDENTTKQVSTPQTGWYPIRIGYSNGGGGSNFELTHSDTGAPSVSWTRDRLRARTSELTGVLRTVFGHQILGGGQQGTPPVSRFEQSALLKSTNFSPTPQGAGNDDWSARYTGQVYIEQAGDYTLTITSDDGSRGRLGGVRAESHWRRDDGVGSQDTVNTLTPASLAVGWNDVTVDYNEFIGGQSLRVELRGGDFASPVDVPADRLRPVEPADDRLALGIDEQNRQINDNGGAGNPVTATMPVAGLAGEIVDSIELTYEANSNQWNDIRVDLETPGGTRVNLSSPGGLQDGPHFVQLPIPANAGGALATLLNGDPKGDWRFHIYDVIGGGGNSSFGSARLTLHTKGGPDRIATTAMWTSVPIDATSNLITLDRVSWTERKSAGSTVSVRVRSCQDATCSDNPKWSDPVTNGSSAPVAPLRYLQLQVEMTSDGKLEPEVGSLAVAYHRST